MKRQVLGLLFALLPLAASASGSAPPVAPGDEATAPALSSSAELDPWERYNRGMYRFNRGFDRIVFRPIAKGYDVVTPKLVKKGVSNFFDNLQQPVVTLNLILQGRPKPALASFGRFLMNSTLGLGGIFDPATEARIPRHRGDFGQTFGRWGWQRSRYLVLPIFGPATLRDTFGKGVNTGVSPVERFSRENGAEWSILYGIDARASALGAESLLEDAADEYLFVRDAYLQNRRCQIVDCSEELPDYLLPDYEFEVPDFESLDRLRR